MNEAQTKVLEMLRQPDASWFTMDAAARQALHGRLSAALAQPLPPPGSPPAPATAVPAVFALAGPAKVPVARSNDVPLLVAAQFSGLRGWEVQWGSNLLLVAADLATGQVRVGHGKDRDRMRPPPPSRSGPPPDATEQGARMVTLERRDLGALVGNLTGPARYAVTALYYDWKSNTTLVDVAGAEGATAPAARVLDASHVRAVDVAAIGPDTPLGVTVSAPSEVAADAAVPVRVTAKVPLGVAGLQPAEPGQAPSLLPVTALLVQRDRFEVPQVELAAPARVQGQDAASRVALAVFEFDLRAAAEDPLPAGDYLLYVVAGGVLSSARPLSLR